MNTKTASYIFLAILAIVGLGSALQIHLVSKEMETANADIARAEEYGEAAEEKLDETITELRAEAWSCQEMALPVHGGDSDPSTALPENPEAGEPGAWGSDTPE